MHITEGNGCSGDDYTLIDSILLIWYRHACSKIGGARLAFSNITKQIAYASGAGRYYSWWMVREFKPGRWSVSLGIDNKADESSQRSIYLIEKLIMGQYNAVTQNAPCSGYGYIFYVGAQLECDYRLLGRQTQHARRFQ